MPTHYTAHSPILPRLALCVLLADLLGDDAARGWRLVLRVLPAMQRHRPSCPCYVRT